MIQIMLHGAISQLPWPVLLHPDGGLPVCDKISTMQKVSDITAQKHERILVQQMQKNAENYLQNGMLRTAMRFRARLKAFLKRQLIFWVYERDSKSMHR